MLPEAVAKFEQAARLVGSAAGLVADALGLLRKGAGKAEPGQRQRGPRLRSLPEPSAPVSEIDRARAERAMKQRGIVGDEPQ